MKTQTLCLALCLALAACGDPGKDSPPTKKSPPLQDKTQPAAAAALASDRVKQVALDRLEVLAKITAVLASVIKPKQDPEGALLKEKELVALFAEYGELGKIAAAEGLTPLALAKLTARTAPDEWRDIRAEFQQYELLVKQLGQPQREMMERVMTADMPTSAPAVPTDLQKHLDQLKIPAPAPGGTPEPRERPRPAQPE